MSMKREAAAPQPIIDGAQVGFVEKGGVRPRLKPCREPWLVRPLQLRWTTALAPALAGAAA
jgi:hypothetical protein